TVSNSGPRTRRLNPTSPIHRPSVVAQNPCGSSSPSSSTVCSTAPTSSRNSSVGSPGCATTTRPSITVTPECIQPSGSCGSSNSTDDQSYRLMAYAGAEPGTYRSTNSSMLRTWRTLSSTSNAECPVGKTYTSCGCPRAASRSM